MHGNQQYEYATKWVIILGDTPVERCSSGGHTGGWYYPGSIESGSAPGHIGYAPTAPVYAAGLGWRERVDLTLHNRHDSQPPVDDVNHNISVTAGGGR